MRIGVLLLAARFPGQSDGQVLTATAAAAVAAERAGFDDVWIAEHHFMSYGICPSATTLAAFVLGQTARITVGTAVSVLSTSHPVALAEQAALLDHVSAGRFRLGVGRGGPWVDLEVFGTSLERHESGFAEAPDAKGELELAFFLCSAPPGTTLAGLVAVAGARWAVEDCFAEAKNETGLDHYQVRRYRAWYRHITLSMLAHAFLAVTAAAANSAPASGVGTGKRGPGACGQPFSPPRT